MNDEQRINLLLRTILHEYETDSYIHISCISFRGHTQTVTAKYHGIHTSMYLAAKFGKGALLSTPLLRIYILIKPPPAVCYIYTYMHNIT